MTQLKCFVPDADDDGSDETAEPGGLLAELERRQDEVLQKLDELNDRVEAVLRELGVRLDEAPEPILEADSEAA